MSTLIFKNAVSILGLTRSKFVFGGMIPRSRIKIVLIKPATPLAPSRWPIFVFTAPLKQLDQRGHEKRVSNVRRLTRKEDHPYFLLYGMLLQGRSLLWDPLPLF